MRPTQGMEDATEVGYGLHSEYWGRGYASEALGMFVEVYWTPGREDSFFFCFMDSGESRGIG